MGKDISYNQLATLVKQGALLVDVREEDERLQGTGVKWGEHWPLSTFGIRKQNFPKNKPVIFYCRSGMRSMQAAEIASNWTNQDVYFLQGGYASHDEKDNT